VLVACLDVVSGSKVGPGNSGKGTLAAFGHQNWSLMPRFVDRLCDGSGTLGAVSALACHGGVMARVCVC